MTTGPWEAARPSPDEMATYLPLGARDTLRAMLGDLFAAEAAPGQQTVLCSDPATDSGFLLADVRRDLLSDQEYRRLNTPLGRVPLLGRIAPVPPAHERASYRVQVDATAWQPQATFDIAPAYFSGSAQTMDDGGVIGKDTYVNNNLWSARSRLLHLLESAQVVTNEQAVDLREDPWATIVYGGHARTFQDSVEALMGTHGQVDPRTHAASLPAVTYCPQYNSGADLRIQMVRFQRSATAGCIASTVYFSSAPTGEHRRFRAISETHYTGGKREFTSVAYELSAEGDDGNNDNFTPLLLSREMRAAVNAAIEEQARPGLVAPNNPEEPVG